MLANPRDVVGEDMRAAGIQIPAMLKWSGKAPVVLPLKDVYAALEAGTVDGAAAPLHAYHAFELYEVALYFCVDYAFTSLAGLSINSNVWNSLDKKTRKIITKAAQDFAVEMLARVKQLDADALQRIEGYEGVTVKVLTPEERADWRQASEDVWQAWLDELGDLRPVGEEIIDIALEHNPPP
jgi:TRAP-type C4-dicarboxylate transport system substrate-binding protein